MVGAVRWSAVAHVQVESLPVALWAPAGQGEQTRLVVAVHAVEANCQGAVQDVQDGHEDAAVPVVEYVFARHAEQTMSAVTEQAEAVKVPGPQAAEHELHGDPERATV